MSNQNYDDIDLTFFQRFKLFMGWYDTKSLLIWYIVSVLSFTILNIIFGFSDYSYTNNNPVYVFVTMFFTYWLTMIFLIPFAPLIPFGIFSGSSSTMLNNESIIWFYIPMIISSLYMRSRGDLKKSYFERIGNLRYGYGYGYRYQPPRPAYQNTPISTVPKKLSENEIFCYKCGEPVKKNIRFCPFCGAASRKIKEEKKTKSNEELINILIGMVSVRKQVKLDEAAKLLEISSINLEKLIYDAIGKDIANLVIDENNIITMKVSSEKLPEYYEIDDIEAKMESDYTCMVCKTSISKNENYAACPHCDHNAHINHLKEWLKVNNLCPVCKQLLSPEEIIIVNVKKK